MLRRMSLTGDAMAHAILPGAALGYLVAGLSLPAMTIGGILAGIVVAVLGRRSSRAVTVLKEDASLAAFYLISLALGVTIVSLNGSNVDLLHVLFGTVLALDDDALILLAAIATVTLATLARALPAARARMRRSRSSCARSAAPAGRPISSSSASSCSTSSAASRRSARCSPSA